MAIQIYHGLWLQLPYNYYGETSHIPPKTANKCRGWLDSRSLACKLTMNPPLLTKYYDIFTDQENFGFIERVTDPTSTRRCHYIPPQGVFHYSFPQSSCHQARDQSNLNNCLLTGQLQLNNLCCIILRFRFHPVGICRH